MTDAEMMEVFNYFTKKEYKEDFVNNLKTNNEQINQFNDEYYKEHLEANKKHDEQEDKINNLTIALVVTAAILGVIALLAINELIQRYRHDKNSKCQAYVDICEQKQNIEKTIANSSYWNREKTGAIHIKGGLNGNINVEKVKNQENQYTIDFGNSVFNKGCANRINKAEQVLKKNQSYTVTRGTDDKKTNSPLQFHKSYKDSKAYLQTQSSKLTSIERLPMKSFVRIV